jgi:hypothetical protein
LKFASEGKTEEKDRGHSHPARTREHVNEVNMPKAPLSLVDFAEPIRQPEITGVAALFSKINFWRVFEFKVKVTNTQTCNKKPSI